jgi:hypothetical protein
MLTFFVETNPIFPVLRLKMMISLKNKPNTNPIQTQYKANIGLKIRVANPNKPNSNPKL